ncbi:MAG: tRNA (adenosine(37)-N6)-threonylcarbamoyltransferase complex ATPase subunit type 1 TsaE [Anaerolineae bacterium]|nr:tRNA (adenosine(37)-N6)-threonylcarbamoyltransferase complex ATPase subunit type 1 TsaE [Anaerolineae bacterium]
MDQHTLDFISHSADQTRRLGTRLSQLLTGGEVLLLTGELGTGKTCLVQGIGQGLGIEERITSPTFTLINEYVGTRSTLYHVDLYRIADVKATLTLGLDEYLYGDGICAIEWAERIRSIWTEEYLLISLRHIDETKRGIALRPVGHRYERLVERYKHEAFGIQ